jgi:hypothetical protein
MCDFAAFEARNNVAQVFVEHVVQGMTSGLDSCSSEDQHVEFIWNARASTLA